MFVPTLYLKLLLLANFAKQSFAQELQLIDDTNLTYLDKAPPIDLRTNVYEKELNREDKYLIRYLGAAKLVIYYADLELALGVLLNYEITVHDILGGEGLRVMRQFLDTLCTLQPLSTPLQLQFLKDFKKYLNCGVRFFGHEIHEWIVDYEEKNGKVFAATDYVGCHGSKPELRGWTCTLWQLFHFMTVQGSDLGEGFFRPPYKAGDMIKLIMNFVKNFYARCPDCCEFFVDMAKEKKYDWFKYHDEEIMWLWEFHNAFSKKVGGQGQDPFFKKIAFPSTKYCKKCQTNKYRWRKDVILRYLKHIYQKKNLSKFRLKGKEGEKRRTGLFKNSRDSVGTNRTELLKSSERSRKEKCMKR